MKVTESMRFYTGLILIVGFSACSSKPQIKEISSSANPKQEISNVQAAMDNSRTKNVDVLAPTSFTEAKHSLDDAREKQKDDD